MKTITVQLQPGYEILHGGGRYIITDVSNPNDIKAVDFYNNEHIYSFTKEELDNNATIN